MNIPADPRPLILASESRYRAELLSRLGLRFQQSAARVDESAQPGEQCSTLAMRLAQAKAGKLAAEHPDCWVLGSDQVADCKGRLLGKPGTVAAAEQQLRELSGATAEFHTAVCLMQHSSQAQLQALDCTRVEFRVLDHAEIARYVAAEQPLDCAGSFKAEGLGISLFEAIHSQDPTALIGLPLIATSRLLRQAGFRLP